MVLYPHLECSSGDVPETVNTDSVSALYHFICITYDIPHSLPEPANLPVIEDTILESFVFRKDTEKIVSITKLPAGYTDRYGKPKVVGCKYTFDWDALMKSSEGERLLADKSNPFTSEYEAVKQLLDKLSQVVTTDEDDDLFDD